MSIFDDIREGCRHVAENATLVRIDAARLAGYAGGFPIAEVGSATLDPATHHLGHGKDTLAFILTLDAINFGSGYFPHIRKRPGHSGYFTVAAGLKDWFQAEGAPSAERLAKLTQGDCARIFGQDLGAPQAAELMGLFADIGEGRGLDFVEYIPDSSGSPDLDLPIEALDLSERPRNCLRRAQIKTVGELVERTSDDLLNITNFGQKSLDEVIQKLDERGLQLRTKD